MERPVMKLEDIVKQLESFDDDQTIFLDPEGLLSGSTRGAVVWVPDDDSTPDEAAGLKCFLDVWHAKEIIEGKAMQFGISQPSENEKLRLLIDYAQTDA